MAVARVAMALPNAMAWKGAVACDAVEAAVCEAPRSALASYSGLNAAEVPSFKYCWCIVQITHLKLQPESAMCVCFMLGRSFDGVAK